MLEQTLQRLANNDPTLTRIKLNYQTIDTQKAQTLANLLKLNSSVITLELRGNGFGYQGVEAFIDALKVNPSVTTIDLSKNNIGYQGAQIFANVLKINSSVTTVDLGENNIGDKGAIALAEALEINRCVTTLHLSLNNITDEGAKALANTLKTSYSLTTLHLYANNFGIQGTLALADALKTNPYVTGLLYLDESNIRGPLGVETLHQIRGYLERNQTNAENLITAIKSGDSNTVKNLVMDGVNVLYRDAECKNALHYAIQAGHIEIIALLLTSPQLSMADLASSPLAQLTDQQGNTLLHQAVRMAEFNATLALRLIESLCSAGTNRYAKNQAGQYPFQLCADQTDNDNSALKELRQLVNPKPAERLFLDHMINPTHIKPMLEKLSTTFLLMDEFTVSPRSGEVQQTYPLPEELGITLLFDELQLLCEHIESNDFQCEDKAGWLESLEGFLSAYATMTTDLAQAQQNTEFQPEPKKLSEAEQEFAKTFILHLQQINQALFTDQQLSSHRDKTIDHICIPSEWVKTYQLQPTTDKPNKKRKRVTDDATAEPTTPTDADHAESRSEKRQKNDDLSTEDLQKKISELEQNLLLSQAQVKQLEQRLVDAGITPESKYERSNPISFFPTLRK